MPSKPATVNASPAMSSSPNILSASFSGLIVANLAPLTLTKLEPLRLILSHLLKDITTDI